MKRNLLIAVLLISFALLISPAIVAAQDSYTISLEGYTWNHTAITVFIGEHHAAWYDSSFKAHVETAVSDWNEAVDSFWTKYSDHVTSYIHDVQFQLETDKKAADVIVTFALYRGAVPPFAVAGVTGFFTQRNTNVVRGATITIYVASVGADPTLIQKTAEHELGHVLGLGHTAQTDDIMYSVVSANLHITTLDVYGVSNVFGWYTYSGENFPDVGYTVPTSATLPETIPYE